MFLFHISKYSTRTPRTVSQVLLAMPTATETVTGTLEESRL